MNNDKTSAKYNSGSDYFKVDKKTALIGKVAVGEIALSQGKSDPEKMTNSENLIVYGTSRIAKVNEKLSDQGGNITVEGEIILHPNNTNRKKNILIGEEILSLDNKVTELNTQFKEIGEAIKTTQVLTKSSIKVPDLTNDSEEYISYVADKKIYVMGVRNNTQNMQVLDTSECIWEQIDKTKLNKIEAFYGRTVDIHQDKNIYIIGGVKKENKISDDTTTDRIITSDIALNNWNKSHTINMARSYHSSIKTEKYIYIIGGINKNTADAILAVGTLRDIEYHNFTPSHSGKLGDLLKFGRCNHTSVLVGNIIYIIGGRQVVVGEGIVYNDRYKSTLDNVETFNIKDNPALEAGTVYKLQTPRYAHATVTVDTRIYVIGGQNDRGKLDSIEVFDTKYPEKGWRLVLEKLNTPRAFHTAQVVDNKIYVIGGTSPPSIEIFEEVTVSEATQNLLEKQISRLLDQQSSNYKELKDVINNVENKQSRLNSFLSKIQGELKELRNQVGNYK